MMSRGAVEVFVLLEQGTASLSVLCLMVQNIVVISCSWVTCLVKNSFIQLFIPQKNKDLILKNVSHKYVQALWCNS